MNIWLVGAGPHAREYAKVLIDLEQDFEVIGRGSKSADEFQAAIGKSVSTRGLNLEIDVKGAPDFAIIAVSYHKLASVASKLIIAGTRHILLEKPGALNILEIQALNSLASEYGAKVWVAYNRRFYASTALAREMIIDDGGATSCVFELTEWAHTIDPMPLPKVTKSAWMIANSSHVADLAFHLCGKPVDWNAWQRGKISWHPAAAQFCGAGVTKSGALFSYHADWEGPGRWGVEVLTRKRRYIFKPMETLQITNLASTNLEQLKLDDILDTSFKPGLHRQTKLFLDGKTELLCSLEEQSEMISVYSKMAGYKSTVEKND
ncbi:Gfo/Idh/MocA family oxidoreductase [Planktomarina temperata]|nr:Gfo/Idh/MocA family oxidoreductase [Planktomarina temperata]